MFWAITPMGEDSNCLTADCRLTKVGETMTSAWVSGNFAASSVSNASVSARFLFIFQFPATILLLIFLSLDFSLNGSIVLCASRYNNPPLLFQRDTRKATDLSARQ